MGLDAFVSCRCWQDGLVNQPPVPAGLIVEDGAGYLDLSVPYGGKMPPESARRAREELDYFTSAPIWAPGHGW